MPELIEADTDGSHFTWDPSLSEDKLTKDSNEYISEIVMTWAVSKKNRIKWGLDPEPKLELEVKIHIKGYWYKMKTYTLLVDCNACNKDDPDCTSCEGKGIKLKFTGGSWKDSRNPKMFDIVRDQLAWIRMNDAPRSEAIKIIGLAMRIEEYPISALNYSVKPSKAMEEYDEGHQIRKIMRRAQEKMGWEPQAFFQYEYVHARNEDGFEFTAIATLDDINYTKYREIIAKIADRFGYGDYAWDWVDIPPLYEIEDLPSW